MVAGMVGCLVGLVGTLLIIYGDIIHNPASEMDIKTVQAACALQLCDSFIMFSKLHLRNAIAICQPHAEPRSGFQNNFPRESCPSLPNSKAFRRNSIIGGRAPRLSLVVACTVHVLVLQWQLPRCDTRQ